MRVPNEPSAPRAASLASHLTLTAPCPLLLLLFPSFSSPLSTGPKPPSSAQSPDPTLEDGILVDFDVTDVDNTLPATATGETDTGADSKSSSNGDEATDSEDDAEEGAAADAMDVDSVATPTKNDASDPMDVSTETDTHTEEEATENGVAAAEATPPTSDESKVDSPVETPSAQPALSRPLAVAPPSPSAPAVAATATAPSSPLSLGAAAVAAPPASAPYSPLTDPTSIIRMESYEHIKDTVIPCLQTLILDNNAEVRAAACDSLVRAADVLRGDDVGKVVLTLVLNLAHDERDEQRTTAVHLMHELAPRLGHDLCRSFVALELAAFADDSTFRVRKATAQSFGNVCEMVGEQFTVSKLLPCYVKLSKDLIWGVRKGCVESLVAVTRVVGTQTKTDIIIPMFERFAKDSSRWVRNGAYEILGPFLHALGPELVSASLLTYFTNIPTMSSAIIDQEVNYHAAFNLPAVLTTIGRDRWEELMPCFNALAKDIKFPVRRTLAYSLHELALLLGPARTESSLLPVVDFFLRDLDEVRYGVLKNFAHLLRCMAPKKRLAYLEVIHMVQKQNDNWRWRLLWAKQLGAFAKLFDAEKTVTHVVPLAFALCRDQVASVRRTAATAMGRLVARLLTFASSPTPVLARCLADIHAFASSRTFMERQLYLHMLEGFVGYVPADLFEQCLERAVPLATDATSNVRLTLVETMRVLLSHDAFHNSPAAAKIVAALTDDAHKEVRRTMREVAQLATTNAAAATALAATLERLAIGATAEDQQKQQSGDAASTSTAPTPASTSTDELNDADLNDILGESGASKPDASSEAGAQPVDEPTATATGAEEAQTNEPTAADDTDDTPQHDAPLAGDYTRDL